VRRKMRTTVVKEGGRGRGVIVAEPVVPAALHVTPASFSHSSLLGEMRRSSAILATGATDIEAERHFM
jgi:hypothetical protein